jgi:hypothetical protein
VAWELATTRLAARLAYPGDQWRAAGDTAGATPLAGQAEAFAWLEAERPNLLATSRQAADAPGPVAAMVGPLAAAALFRYLQMGGYWKDLKELNQAALQVAKAAGDRAGEAQALSDLATACWWLRDLDQAVACNRQSLQLRRARGTAAARVWPLATSARTTSPLGSSTKRSPASTRAWPSSGSWASRRRKPAPSTGWAACPTRPAASTRRCPGTSRP